MKYKPSELILNEDGSIFHLHLHPGNLARKIILVGDPERVNLIGNCLDTIEFETQNREFHTITGTCQGKRISIVSTGIGCDNIDIVLTELDALANIDLHLRDDKPVHESMDIVRIGTCGGLQPFTPVGTFICSDISIGFDGLLNFYQGRNAVCDLPLERQLINHLGWTGNTGIPYPYAIHADNELAERIAGSDMVHGITVSCGGFYGPQGRQIRIPLADPNQNEKIVSFEYNGQNITNYEMESSAVAGLSRLLGHRAVTVCMVIANRVAGNTNTNYKHGIEELVRLVLDRI
ncbi:MAG: nucleoside phosphorylase [Prevotella sp.]